MATRATERSGVAHYVCDGKLANHKETFWQVDFDVQRRENKVDDRVSTTEIRIVDWEDILVRYVEIPVRSAKSSNEQQTNQ